MRLTLVDSAMLPHHPYLTSDDRCLFVGEYSRRAGYGASPVNQTIFNLKKPIDRRGRQDWHYKLEAIATVAHWLRTAVRNEQIPSLTFVPMPPSKAKDDPLYDDRMLAVCQQAFPADAVCELLVQRQSRAARHNSNEIRDPNVLIEAYAIDERYAAACRSTLVVVDDVLNTGSSFRAAKTVLMQRFPLARVVGLFVARCLPEADFSFD